MEGTSLELQRRQFRHLRRLSVALCAVSLLTGVVCSALCIVGLAAALKGPYAYASLCALLATSLLLVATSLLGLLGLRKQSLKLMKLSFTILFLVVLLYGGTAVFTHLKLRTLKPKLTAVISNYMRHYGTPFGQQSGGDKLLDQIQAERQCCGAEKALDWNFTSFSKIPASCNRTDEFSAVGGCVDALVELYEKTSSIIVVISAWLTGFLGLILVVVTVFCCLLQNSSWEYEEQVSRMRCHTCNHLYKTPASSVSKIYRPDRHSRHSSLAPSTRFNFDAL
ncbi:hypothetical protein RvY_06395 [Ramazzottius varieornatus]|uniref:Tetraspanin n=1 Tax=Ramazzottius varieornatus TaxID=947166 RepID=A0A1D1V1W4_RAMVA|nr:hypothetical protein RvY_06395 [Ramazzottius varieornatus]